MSLVLFEGAAGTGKSTRLLTALREHLAAHPLAAGQRVLALTKLHGSRRRMESRLRCRAGLGPNVDCVTIDSFAWRLVRRWRGLVRHLGAAPRDGDFQSITAAAGLLLSQRHVGDWLGRRYPLIAIDEMQDCKGGEVQIVAGLVPCVQVVAAADGFQDLSGDSACEAVDWARDAGQVVTLDHNHRTNAAGLIAAALALRNGTDLLSDRRSGFEFTAVPKAPLGGSSLSWRLQLWSPMGEVAVLSPTRPGTSRFVDSLLEWVHTKTAKAKGSGATAGPFSLPWEAADEQMCSDIAKALDLPTSAEAGLACTTLAEAGRRIGAPELSAWADRQRNLIGRQSVTVAAVREQVAELVRRRRAFGRSRERKRIALTVHQAKNREFESVVVLWPLKVSSNLEQQRRLLYNGITRARRHALVIVEDPQRDRTLRPPFRARAEAELDSWPP